MMSAKGAEPPPGGGQNISKTHLDRLGGFAYKPPRRKASAQVAQLVEHATENRSVGGSIPPLGTILSP